MIEVIEKKAISETGWNTYLKEFSNATHEYTGNMIEYRKAYSAYLKEDLSCVFIENGKPVIMMPLFLEEYEGMKCFSSAKSYGVIPLINSRIPLNNQGRILNDCFEYINDLAKQRNIKKALFRFDPLINSDRKFDLYDYNFLMKYDYQNASINSQIIDLSIDKESLWQGLRKRFRSIINNAIKTYDFEIYDSKGIDIDVFNKYQEIHYKAAGKMTRPQLTFDIMFKQICDDEAFLLFAKHEKQYVLANFYLKFNHRVYYASGAELPDVQLLQPIGHGAQWTAIEYMKKSNIAFYEIGWQQFGKQTYDSPSDKEVNISFYKRGFGGRTVSLYRGIKNYEQ